MSAPLTHARATAALPTLDEFRTAAARIRGIAASTPLVPSPALSAIAGCEVLLKLETRQPTRSFKLRGAANALVRRTADGTRAVVAASAGNHGAGVAYAANACRVRATVFVPASAPAAKRARIAALGASLRLVDGDYDAAEDAAAEHARAQGVPFVHAFDDADVIAGQGTIALEAVAALPGLRTLVVPVGGGGLAAGAGAALRALGSDAGAIGVQSVATSAMHAAFAAGGPVPYDDAPTLADGLAGRVTDASYLRAREVLRDLVLVEERDIARGMRFLALEHGVVAEGSAAVGVAAVLAQRVALHGPAVLVVTGANVDAAVLSRVLDGE